MALSDKLLRKTKLLYIKEILERYTDADHDITQVQIQEKLEKKHIDPKTRTLHDDIESLYECLPDFGMELTNNVKPGKNKAHTLRYKITKRLFTPTEVKLLMESVRGLKSLSAEQTTILIDKLSSLCSDAEARDIKKHFAVVGGFKAFWYKRHKHDLTLTAIETIDKAIDNDSQIKFRYGWPSMSTNKPSFPRDKTYRHVVSPLVRVLEGGYCYLIATDEIGTIHHYRLDRMVDIETVEEKRKASPYSDFTKSDWVDYVNSSFGLGLTYPNYLLGYHTIPPVTNHEITVTAQFTRDLVGVVMDRFGRNVLLTPTDKGHFRASFHAYQNVQFLTWLVGLGKKVQIISPTELRKDLSRFARQAGCWHYYSKYVPINEYNAWKKRTPYWTKYDDSPVDEET